MFLWLCAVRMLVLKNPCIFVAYLTSKPLANFAIPPIRPKILNEETDDEREEDRDLDDCCSGDFGDGIGRCLLDSTETRHTQGRCPATRCGSEQTIAIVGRTDHRDQRPGKRPRSIRLFGI